VQHAAATAATVATASDGAAAAPATASKSATAVLATAREGAAAAPATASKGAAAGAANECMDQLQKMLSPENITGPSTPPNADSDSETQQLEDSDVPTQPVQYIDFAYSIALLEKKATEAGLSEVLYALCTVKQSFLMLELQQK